MSATKEFHHDEIGSNQRLCIILIKDYPVLFDTEMVQAILSGKKTSTRRLFKKPLSKAVEPAKEIFHDGTHWVARLKNGQCYRYPIICPYGETGDYLWVKETFCPPFKDQVKPAFLFKADYHIGVSEHKKNKNMWKPSIHMPRAAARLWLEITELKPQRIQSITEQEAMKEGVMPAHLLNFEPEIYSSYRAGFYKKWISIYGIESWHLNPWVWTIDFKPISGIKIPPV